MSAAPLSAARAASAWLIRIREADMDAKERAEFEAWLAVDPAHQAAFARVSKAVGAAGALGPDLRAYMSERPAPRASAFMSAAAALAACLLIAVGVGFWTLRIPTYATALGEQRSIALADGTHVELNTNSRLEVRFTDAERRVRLTRGEAMFEVVSDAARPFIVEAERRQVRAIGTAFSVRVDGDNLHVLVVEGVVSVAEAQTNPTPSSPTQDTPRLIAGQALAIADAQPHLATLADAEITRSLSWRSGMLQFDGQPLEEAAAEVARYTGARFVFEDARARATPVWGYFSAADLEGFLSGLEQNAPELAVTRSGKDVAIARRS